MFLIFIEKLVGSSEYACCLSCYSRNNILGNEHFCARNTVDLSDRKHI